MKTFLELSENVKTADRKPEQYTKPDGKKGTRMVPVDKEVIKQEKTLEWLKSALAREAKAAKPREDDLDEAYNMENMCCKNCGDMFGKPTKENKSCQYNAYEPKGKNWIKAEKQHEKVECPKCKGKGCDHCDNKGYHTEAKEAHDPKHVKQAVGIASDPRYKGGNMTGATKVINKLSKGLSDHPQVKAVLKRQNEGINELDKKTLGSYIKKAGPDAVKQKAQAARHSDAGDMANKDKDMYKHYAKSQRAMDKAANRQKGIGKAVDKLTRESNVSELTIADVLKATEKAKKRQEKERKATGKSSVSTTDLAARKKVSELSNAKMGQYVRKAADDAARKGSAGDVAGARQRVKGVSKAMDKIDKNRLFGRSGTTYSGYKK